MIGTRPGGGSNPRSDGPLWRVARNLGVYSIGSLISLICSSVLLPVYAVLFSPRQFGVVATGQVVGLIAITIARLGLNNGMFRHVAEYHGQEDREAENRAISTAMAVSFVTSSAVTLVLLGGLWVAGSGIPDLEPSGILIAANIALSAPRETAEFALQAMQKSRVYVVFTSTTTVLTTALTVALAIALHGNAAAVFGSALAANSLMSVVGVVLVREWLHPRSVSAQELRLEARFGIPGLPALLSDWVTQFSDRFFLTHYVGLAQVGIYSLGYRFGLIVQQVLGAATTASWGPFVLTEYRKEDGSRTIGRVATYFAMLGMALVLLISGSAPLFFLVVHARPEYHAANAVIFLIALANFFGVMQYIFSTPPMIRLRPEVGTLFRAVGALVNLILNFVLISRFGMLGAAWSTLATFAFIAVITEVISRRMWRIQYEYRKLGLIVVGGVLVQLLIAFVQRPGTLPVLVLSPLLGIGLYAAWLLATATFSRDELRALMQRVRYRST